MPMRTLRTWCAIFRVELAVYASQISKDILFILFRIFARLTVEHKLWMKLNNSRCPVLDDHSVTFYLYITMHHCQYTYLYNASFKIKWIGLHSHSRSFVMRIRFWLCCNRHGLRYRNWKSAPKGWTAPLGSKFRTPDCIVGWSLIRIRSLKLPNYHTHLSGMLKVEYIVYLWICINTRYIWENTTVHHLKFGQQL